eukprot:TRINITY_DN5716_c0_g1_i1.p1 TRINITY_DN5716_c0_g1~~TRINITY_DN5716_c0_g1_i1.p1  ORF type:complete len:456 (+),score=64.21 TRINITY_DN5716_c0_g1_i1:793-2160(+)
MPTVEELVASLKSSSTADDAGPLLECLILKVRGEVMVTYENVVSTLKEFLQPVSLMLRGDEDASVREEAMVKIEKLIRMVSEINATQDSLSSNESESKSMPYTNPLYDHTILSTKLLSQSEKTRCEIRELRALRAELEGEINLLREDLRSCNGAYESYRAMVSSRINVALKEVSEIRSKFLDHQPQPSSSDSEDGSEPSSAVLTTRITELEKQLSQLNKQIDTSATPLKSSAKSQYREEKRLRVENTFSNLYKDDPMEMIYEVLRVAIGYKFLSPEDFLIRFANDFSKCTPVSLLDKIQSRSNSRTTIKDKYLAECNALSCKPNSGVLRQLEKAGDGSSMKELDLSNNLISDSGLRPLLPILQHLKNLEILNLCDNGIQNSSVQVLTEEIRDHPSITSLDLSDNRLSRSAGKDLLSLVVGNRKIKTINLSGTRIDDALRKRLADKITELNANVVT